MLCRKGVQIGDFQQSRLLLASFLAEIAFPGLRVAARISSGVPEAMKKSGPYTITESGRQAKHHPHIVSTISSGGPSVSGAGSRATARSFRRGSCPGWFSPRQQMRSAPPQKKP